MIHKRNKIIMLTLISIVVITMATGCEDKSTQTSTTPAPVHNDELTLISSQPVALNGNSMYGGIAYIYHDNVNNGTVYVFTGENNLVVGGAAIPAQ